VSINRSITVSVPLEPRSYQVQIGAGAIALLPAQLEAAVGAPAYAVVSDAGVSRAVGEPLHRALQSAGLRATLHVHAAGEQGKTRAAWSALTDELLAAALGRDGCVIAIGGGVTGDLAGFVAATYMRGIAHVLVPTTLLAMVDAAVGGKTGVDTDAGKNLVGAFHPPRFVCIDPALLATLPGPEYRAGLAEMVKHAAIADERYLREIEVAAPRLPGADADALAALIARSVEIKAQIVAADPFEEGVRAMLNFGHTLGHALEGQQQFRVRHGEAVSIGMVLAARIGEHLGVTRAGTAAVLRAVLESLQLPVALPPQVTIDALLPFAAFDKKARAGLTRYVLLERPGAVARNDGHWTFEVPADTVRVALGPSPPAGS
jgi:3-dehydroquinate synthase